MEENNNIKNITTDELAVMIKNGFDAMDKRFDRIENILIKQQNDKIERLEKRMERIEEALVIK
ncbi:MAG: hypothetical protein ABIJ84_00860 [bacterium]